ncbi:hypothetical protein ES288_D02G176200v1 [Gossypium darwinii]|uniref:Uncharacterized protein n=1 Tax=Gossypium darwinii TaxID=34276 RepID=A0A5D2DF21_GOSDA|nr:hypothetical protein ES288_D02G176200v1 [Gossypium darwinii]
MDNLGSKTPQVFILVENLFPFNFSHTRKTSFYSPPNFPENSPKSRTLVCCAPRPKPSPNLLHCRRPSLLPSLVSTSLSAR